MALSYKMDVSTVQWCMDQMVLFFKLSDAINVLSQLDMQLTIVCVTQSAYKFYKNIILLCELEQDL